MTDPKSAGTFLLDPLGPHLEGIKVEAKFAQASQVDLLRMKATTLKFASIKMQSDLRKELGEDGLRDLGEDFMTEEVHKLNVEFADGCFKAMLLKVHSPTDDQIEGSLEAMEPNVKTWIGLRLLDMQNLRRCSFPLGEAVVTATSRPPPADPPSDASRGSGSGGLDQS